MKYLNDYFIQVIGIDDTTLLEAGDFKQLQIQKNISIPAHLPEVGQILSVTVRAEIKETQIITTPISKSNEGQALSGKKILVRGILFYKLEYVMGKEDQPLYSIEFKELFSDDIVIDHNTDCITPVIVTPYIEDADIRQISKRNIFISVILLINGVSPSQYLYEKPSNDNCKSLLQRFELSKYRKANINERYFTQIVTRQRINIPVEKPDIQQVNTTIINPEIISMKVINTLRGRSKEGQNLTGKKIVAALKINRKILYTGDIASQSIHGMEEQQYINISVAVPEQIEGTPIETLLRNKCLQPKITVEDVFTIKINERMMDTSIIACLEFIYIPCYEICYTEQDSKTERNLFVAHENGLYRRQINRDENVMPIKPKWSPNGQEIACLSKQSGKYLLCIINIKTLLKRTFLKDNVFEAISSFCWLRDGRKIIFSGIKNKNKEIYSFDLESLKCEQITQGNGLIKSFQPEGSPDGKRIAYFTSANNMINIWSSDITGGNSKQLTYCGYVKNFDWLYKDKLIYISGKGIAQDEIYVIDINTLDRVSILEDSEVYIKKFVKVSPCGQYAALIGKKSNNDMDDVYLYEFKNKCIINITQNISVTKVSDLVWSADSDKVYYVSDELGYCNIYSISLKNFCKKQITNTTATDIKINYRPRVR